MDRKPIPVKSNVTVDIIKGIISAVLGGLAVIFIAEKRAELKAKSATKES